MSFFRNFRSTKSRSKSTSCNPESNFDSRPGSAVSHNTSITTMRRDSIESRPESLLNRSDTFILHSDTEEKESPPLSNNSTLEKKSKKSKVLSKFSTFTKRKKTPTPEPTSATVKAPEHHPSENATNTYYKWKSDGPSTLDYYDSQTDPFNFLYEQQSSLKAMQNGSGCSSGTNGTSALSSGCSSTFDSSTFRKSKMPTQLKEQLTHGLQSGCLSGLDSSTYRKGKIPIQLKEQLTQLKSLTKPHLYESDELRAESRTSHEAHQSDADKYKTVTLNSFRKSFREKFLQNQNNAPHNPAWFVEVETPAWKHEQRESKENRPDYLVFENENYRPNSNSPIRDRKDRSSPIAKRSPVKRNETFRLERPTVEKVTTTNTHVPASNADGSSIRIEIKNSISPHMPGRFVPVGVAKPMLSPCVQEYYKNPNVNAITKESKLLSIGNLRDKSPQRSTNWSKSGIGTPARYPTNKSLIEKGRYQTRVHIRNEANAKPTKLPGTPGVSLSNRGRAATRIQLGSNSPTTQKRLNTPGTRHSIATPTHISPIRSADLVKHAVGESSTNRVQDKAHGVFYNGNIRNMYFDETQKQRPIHSATSILSEHRLYGGYTDGNTRAQPQAFQKLSVPLSSGSSPNHSRSKTRDDGGGSGFSFNLSGRREPQQQLNQHHPQQQQQQQRTVVSVQRRSRSPIKLPWR